MIAATPITAGAVWLRRCPGIEPVTRRAEEGGAEEGEADAPVFIASPD